MWAFCFCLQGHTAPVNWVTWSHIGDRLVSLAPNDGTVRIWRWEDLTPQHIIIRQSTGEAAATAQQVAGPRRTTQRLSGKFDMATWSLDDKFVITAQSATDHRRSATGADAIQGENVVEQRIKVWDSHTGALLHILLGHTLDVRLGAAPRFADVAFLALLTVKLL